MSEGKTLIEEIHITGDELVAKVKELVHEGNIRRIIVKNEEGRTLIEIPLTLGVVGALLVPTLAALGAIAALVTKCTIIVVKEEDAAS
jgi:CBS domain-containing protein